MRQDLPIPFSYALTGAALALVVSFVGLGALWHRARFEDRSGGRALPRVTAVLDAPSFRWLLRGLGLVITVLALSTAVLGEDVARNPFPGTVYVLFWIGLLAVGSLLLGPVWRALNPLRTLHLLLVRATGGDEREGLLRYPAWLGCWPATAMLLSFGWLELVADDRSSTRVLLTYVAFYSAVMLVGATLFGSRWFDRADGLEKYSTVIGRLSVLGRRDGDRAVVLRNPLTNLAGLRQEVGLPAFVAAMLAITAFDAYSSSTSWIRWSQQGSLAPQTAGTLALIGVFALVLVSFGLVAGLAGRVGGSAAHSAPRAFAHTLVPIAVGYVVAHYYSLLVLGAQQTLNYYSDPFQTGADWLGLAGNRPSYVLVTPTAVAVVQVAAVVTGHVVGVVAAHDRSVAMFPRARAVAGQLPLLALMVVYTVTGLTLLFEF